MPSAWSFAWTRALPAHHTHFGICHIVQHVAILHRMWADGTEFRWGKEGPMPAAA
jgi:hypothetical protein